jgi:hypothetical protein
MPFRRIRLAPGAVAGAPGRRRLWLGQQRVALGLDRLQLLVHHLQPVQLAQDLPLQLRRQRPSVSGPQRLQRLLPATLQQGLIASDPLGVEQPLDAVGMLRALAHQPLALQVRLAPVLRLRARSTNHRADPRLSPLPRHQRAKQRLPVDLVALGPPLAPIHRHRSGVDNSALDLRRLQRTVQPEPIQPRFLNADDAELPARPLQRLALQLIQQRQQARQIAARHRMAGHLLPRPRRQRRHQPALTTEFQ